MKYIDEAYYKDGIVFYRYKKCSNAPLDTCINIVKERRAFSLAYGEFLPTIIDVTDFDGADQAGLDYWSTQDARQDVSTAIFLYKKDILYDYTYSIINIPN